MKNKLVKALTVTAILAVLFIPNALAILFVDERCEKVGGSMEEQEALDCTYEILDAYCKIATLFFSAVAGLIAIVAIGTGIVKGGTSSAIAEAFAKVRGIVILLAILGVISFILVIVTPNV